MYKINNKSRESNLKNPKVSVIIPSLNVVSYTKECIGSVINQSLRDIEIICVDARSTDGTLELLKYYKSRDKRIRLIISDKKSMGHQYNLGIKAAKGEYIGFVESDDFIKPNMYERLYNTTLSAGGGGLDIIKSDFTYFSRNPSKEIKAQMPSRIYNKIFTAEALLLDKNINTFRFVWNSLYKTSFIKHNNILFHATPGAAYQDTGFFFYTTILAKSIYWINENFYMYRQDRQDSSCNRKDQPFAINKEMQLIRTFLDTHLEFQRFYPYITRIQFENYLGMFYRTAEEFKLEYIKQISEEFKVLEKANKLDTSFLSEKDLKILKFIIRNPIKFYKNYQFKQGKFNQILRHPKKIFKILAND